MKALALAVIACVSAVLPPAAGGPGARSATGRGVTATLPAGWQAAPSSLTPHLLDPREVLSVATYRLRYRPGACSHMPSSALADIGPDGALVTLQERGRDPGSSWAGFPARPVRFGAHPGDGSEAAACVPDAQFDDHWFTFTDGGRHFHVLVAFGPHAPAGVQRQAWAILDGLKVDPAVRPDWSATP